MTPYFPPPSSMTPTRFPTPPPLAHTPFLYRKSIWDVFPNNDNKAAAALRPSDRFKENDVQSSISDERPYRSFNSSPETFKSHSKRNVSEPAADGRWLSSVGRVFSWGKRKGRDQTKRGWVGDDGVAREEQSGPGVWAGEGTAGSGIRMKKGMEDDRPIVPGQSQHQSTQSPCMVSPPLLSTPSHSPEATSTNKPLCVPEQIAALLPRPPPLVHFQQRSLHSYRQHVSPSLSYPSTQLHYSRRISSSPPWALGSLPRLCSEYWHYGILAYTPAYLSPQNSASSCESEPDTAFSSLSDISNTATTSQSIPLTRTYLLAHKLSHLARLLLHHALNTLTLILALPLLVPYEISFALIYLIRAAIRWARRDNGGAYRNRRGIRKGEQGMGRGGRGVGKGAWRRGCSGRRRGCMQRLQDFLAHPATEGVMGWGVFCGGMECIGVCLGRCLEER
ncbi:MAG: hypothetical protein M1840_001853 [Geoglossum simile]|nr:MAG: hypothetical protein M1840_001853 [Geoglossum simile]